MDTREMEKHRIRLMLDAADGKRMGYARLRIHVYGVLPELKGEMAKRLLEE